MEHRDSGEHGARLAGGAGRAGEPDEADRTEHAGRGEAVDRDTGADRSEGAGRGGGAGRTGGRVVGVAVAMTCLITLMLLAFALPATHSGPDHLKTGVLRSQAAALPSGPEARGGGPRPELVQYESPADLRRAVRDREISGGFVVGRQAVTVYTATAGGPPAANAVRAMGEAIAGQAQLDVDVTDLAPFPSDDPQGTGLSAAALPMILGGIIPAVGFLQLFPGRRRVGLRLAGAGLFSLFAGFAVATVLSRVTGTLDGPLVPEALGLALGMAALSYTFLGLHAVLGMAGLGAGVGTMMLLGNPLSGLATGDDWLPGGWAVLGQLLPPGASGSLLRGTAYFDGAGTTAPLLVLVGWVLLGLTLALVANLLPRRGSSRPA